MQREDIDLSFQNIGRNDGYSSSRLGRRREDRRNHPLPQEGDLLSITNFNQRAEEMCITIALPDRAAYPREVTSIRTLKMAHLSVHFWTLPLNVWEQGQRICLFLIILQHTTDSEFLQ